MATHTVKKGDCLASICKKYGFHDEDIIFSDPANAALKQKRKNMHVLNPKDKVVIPDKETKKQGLNAESTNSFTIKGTVTEIAIKVEDFEGNALSGKLFILDVEGKKYEGKTDASGLVNETVDASATVGELTVYLDDTKKNNLFWSLTLGGLTPVDELSGVQSRLNNLGYSCDNEDGKNDKSTKAAVNAFKMNNGLSDDDTVDQAVREKLLAEYGF